MAALIEAIVFYFYAVLLLRVAGETIVGTARIYDFVSTVAMGTIIGSTIISRSCWRRYLDADKERCLRVGGGRA